MYKSKKSLKAFELFQKYLNSDNNTLRDSIYTKQEYSFIGETNYDNDILEIAEEIKIISKSKAVYADSIEYDILHISMDFSDYIADYIAFYSVSKQLMNKKEELLFYLYMFHNNISDFVVIVFDSKVELMFWDDFIMNQIYGNFFGGVSYITYSDYQSRVFGDAEQYLWDDNQDTFFSDNRDFLRDLSHFDFETISIEMNKNKVRFMQGEEYLSDSSKWKELSDDENFEFGDIRKVKHEGRYVGVKREIKKKYK